MIPCSQILIFKWLQGHLLRCPFKYITGIDCPGCGFQRSVLALLQGELYKSFMLYPATFPLIIILLYSFIEKKVPLTAQKRTILKKMMYMITGGIILISYTVKIYRLSV